jgi:hypothetical protein
MVAEEASVAATLAVVASKQVASMVADKWPVELVAAAEELALVARAFQVTLRTLLAQDPASLHSEDHRPGSPSTTDDRIER